MSTTTKFPLWIPIGALAILLVALGILLAGYLRGRSLRNELAANGWDLHDYMPMAKEHATKWRADAVLDTLHADQVDPQGRAHLGPTDRLEINYRSPTATTSCVLALDIREHSPALTAEIKEGACTPAPVPPVRCSITDVWTKVLARGGRSDARATISLAHGAWHVEQQDLRFDFVDDCK